MKEEGVRGLEDKCSVKSDSLSGAGKTSTLILKALTKGAVSRAAEGLLKYLTAIFFN